MSDAVLLEVDDRIAVITLNRPDNRNSMTPDLLEAFWKVSKEVRDMQDIRCVVITGKGNCFSAGADFKSNLQTGADLQLNHQRSMAMYEPFLSVLDIEVPVLGALQGHAVGGGFGLSLMCDIRIANRDSKYGANFARLGLHPGMAISYLLPRLIGLSRASEMLYTGRLLKGAEALAMGLVSSALEGEQVFDATMDMARTIAANAPVAVRMTKQSIREFLDWDVRRGALREAFAQAETLTMKDSAEGMAALLEKRPPIFTGK